MGKRKREFKPELRVNGNWRAMSKAGTPMTCGSMLQALEALEARAFLSFSRSKDALHPHEADARVVDEYGAVVWPRVLRGYES